MSLPQSLRESASPAELEFIASQQLIEIIPLIAMERTVFISVSRLANILFWYCDTSGVGNLRSSTTTSKGKSPNLACHKSEAEEEMSYNSS